MDQDAIQKLLERFVSNECTSEEIHKVVDYFKSNNITEAFPTVDDIKMLLEETPKMDKKTADKIFSNVIAEAKETPVIPTRKTYRYVAIAASLVILLSVGWFYQSNVDQSNTPIIIDPNAITLQLENGDIKVISENGTAVVINANGQVVGNQSGNKIVYGNESGLEKLVYNTIKIPHGKRFQLQLSDGTVVHLNAGTTFKYPVKFITGENRQVFLDGEAFFDVSKDKKHPFIVNADELNVRVLGTHFNVSNYPEDEMTDVVLVEGSVGMYVQGNRFDANKNTVLQPGTKGSFGKQDKSFQTKKVNPALYTCWMNGGLYFRNMSFSNISKKLERHYNVVIVNQNNKFAGERFNASFGDESVEKVLSYFKDVYGIKYTIKNNTVTIQ